MNGAQVDRSKELRLAIVGADYERSKTLEDAAYRELVYLWDDLARAVYEARNGCWSIGCEAAALRVAKMTRALGRAVEWEYVQLSLLVAGIYQQFHDLMGIPYDPPDMDVVNAEYDKQMAGARR